MLIRKLTIICIVTLFLSTCTSVEPTQTGGDISTNVPKEINWDKAKEMIFSGEVETIIQAHDRKVILQLKDGSQFITIEPELDGYIQIVTECGVKCANISIMTE